MKEGRGKYLKMTLEKPWLFLVALSSFSFCYPSTFLSFVASLSFFLHLGSTVVVVTVGRKNKNKKRKFCNKQTPLESGRDI